MFRRGLKGRARDFNWHNVFGFWTAIPLFLVVLSATVISYPWASNLVHKIAGSGPPAQAPRPPQQGQPGGREGSGSPEPAALSLAGMDAAVAKAQQAVPGWRTINLRLPTVRDKEATFTIDQGWGGQPQLRSTLALDMSNGEVTRRQTFADQNLGQRARSWLRFVHTGEYYGLTGQTIAGIASFAGVMLVITGISLAVRRLLGWIGRRVRSKEVISGGAELPREQYGER